MTASIDMFKALPWGLGVQELWEASGAVRVAQQCIYAV